MQQKTQPFLRMTGSDLRSCHFESDFIPYRYDTVRTVADRTNTTNGINTIK